MLLHRLSGLWFIDGTPLPAHSLIPARFRGFGSRWEIPCYTPDAHFSFLFSRSRSNIQAAAQPQLPKDKVPRRGGVWGTEEAAEQIRGPGGVWNLAYNICSRVL